MFFFWEKSEHVDHVDSFFAARNLCIWHFTIKFWELKNLLPLITLYLKLLGGIYTMRCKHFVYTEQSSRRWDCIQVNSNQTRRNKIEKKIWLVLSLNFLFSALLLLDNSWNLTTRFQMFANLKILFVKNFVEWIIIDYCLHVDNFT